MLRKVLAYSILLVYDFEFTTPCCTMTSSLIHLYQLGGGGGGKAPLAPLPPSQNANFCCVIRLQYVARFKCRSMLYALIAIKYLGQKYIFKFTSFSTLC